MSANQEVKNGEPTNRSTRELAVFSGKILVLAILFSSAAMTESFRLSSLSSGDAWWHLSAGLWMLQHHTIPHYGILSQYPNLPWIDSSWAYDGLLAVTYRLLGLRAIPILLMLLKAAFAVVTFLIAGGSRGRFWSAACLSAIAQIAVAGMQPLPAGFSILFFVIELSLLYRAWDSSSAPPLLALPVIFLFWVNLHAQFVVGLVLFAVFLAAIAGRQLLRRIRVHQADWGVGITLVGQSAVAFLAMLVACLVNPHGFRIFGEALREVYGKAAFRYLPEMSAMRFRQPQDFVLILFALTAFFGFARRRSLDPLKIGLLTLATLAGLRFARDGWIAVMCALVAFATISSPEMPREPARAGLFAGKRWPIPIVGLVVLSLLALFAVRIPPESELMARRVSKQFPVQACDFIHGNHVAGPLFNAYDWGGFLTWYMPEYPVAMDRRLGLYGYELTDQYFQVIGGTDVKAARSYTDARILLLEKESDFAHALMTFPDLRAQFRVLYSDDVAVVLERR